MSQENNLLWNLGKGFGIGLMVGQVLGMFCLVFWELPFWLEGRGYDIATVLSFAPVYGLPWAIAGSLFGAIINGFGGRLVLMTTLGGMVVGLLCSLLSSSSGNGLLLTMPIDAATGAFFGMIAGLGFVTGGSSTSQKPAKPSTICPNLEQVARAHFDANTKTDGIRAQPRDTIEGPLP